MCEGFVKAAVHAIEQRDPTTFGHSGRVANMTIGLAEVVDRAGDGDYRAVKFSREQLREIRYAGLLHDFGKVGVREQVLVKAKKLYPLQLDLIQQRYDYVRRTAEREFWRACSCSMLFTKASYPSRPCASRNSARLRQNSWK